MTGLSASDATPDLLARLEHVRVADVMRHGLLASSLSTPVWEAAGTMCKQGVHLLLAVERSGAAPVGSLSAGQLLAALLDGHGERPLGEVVSRQLDTVSSGQPLIVAARRMRETGADHLMVRDAVSGRPVGVLSALDVAGAVAFARG